jgi:hypothetical protein
MRKISIASALFFGLAILSGCVSNDVIKEVPVVETRTVAVSKPAPIVPSIDQLRLRKVKWVVIAPENAEEVFASLSGDVVLFALTAEGYEALSLNLSDLRANIQQHKRVIAVYKNSFK